MAPPAPAKPAAAAPVAPAAPVVPKLSATIDAGFDVRIVVDLELKLDDPKLTAELALDNVPLPGRWQVFVGRTGRSPYFFLAHGNLAGAALGHAVDVTCALDWEDGGHFRKIGRGAWPQGSCPRLDADTKLPCPGWPCVINPEDFEAAKRVSHDSFDVSQRRKYRFTIEFHRVALSTSKTSAELAHLVSGASSSSLPLKFDVA